MTIEDTYRHIIRLRSGGKQGSGIIYFPDDGSYDIIVTAKHVLNEDQYPDLQIDSLLCNDGSYRVIDISNRKDIVVERCQDADLALVCFPCGELSDIIGSRNNLIVLDRRFDFRNCVSIGYPRENDGIKAIHSRFRAFGEHPNYIIESKTSEDELLQTLGSDAYDNVVGMSGGGFFYSDGEKVYLAGIPIEFKDAYKDFHSISITKVNEFLVSKGISKITVTYASSFGLNEDWIRTHLTKTRKNLGERYTTAIESLDVPETEYLRYIEVGDSFRSKLGERYHEIIEDLRRDHYTLRNNEITKDLYEYIDSLISKFQSSYHQTKWYIGKFGFESFPLALVEGALSEFEEWDNLIRREQSRIYQERRKKVGNKKSYRYREEPLGVECAKVRHSQRQLREFQNYLKGELIRLSLDPKVLITGKAGKGKSHLLGDTVMTRLDEEKPSLLILGQQLGANDDPRVQILGRLGLTDKCSFQDLQKLLNQIGEFLGERFFFVVDALNEGNGKQFWINEIAGLMEEFKPYPYIALVLSVRSTYLDDVIPEDLLKSEDLVQVEHHGFEGQELEAVQHFCRNFGLEEPGVPLLAPEFSTPLFLLLFCKALKASGKTKFPKGLNGISEVYRSHTQSVSSALNKEFQFGLPQQSNIVEDGINYLLELDSGYGGYRLREVEDHFSKFRKCNGLHLLNGMLRENILTDDIYYFSKEEPRVKVVRFSYERYANHSFVKSLLYRCEDDPNLLIQEGSYLYKCAQNNKYFDRGVLDALAIILPERFDIELCELMTQQWLEQFDLFHTSNETLQGIVIESLQWRSIGSIDFDKISKFIDDFLGDYYINNELFRILIQIASNEEHPLNANYLHQHLAPLSMAERDSFWLEFIYDEFNDPTSSLSRLIDWILEYDQHQSMSRPARILTCTTLGWMLCSPLVPLRDASTIAIVKLLDDDLIVSIDLLRIFNEVNELYIQERLYAAIYGAVIRSDHTGIIHDIASYVYKLIFSSGSPTAHLMLRDYARGIIEYAYHLDASIDLNFDLVRPPYDAELPESLPTIEEVKAKYELEWDKEFSYSMKNGYRGNNAIFTSLVGLNADRNYLYYTINHFSTTSIKCQSEFESLKNSLNDRNSKLLNLILSSKEAILELEQFLSIDGVSQFTMEKLLKREEYSEEEMKEFIEKHRSEQGESKGQLELHRKSLEKYLNEFPSDRVEDQIRSRQIVSDYLQTLSSSIGIHDRTQNFLDYAPWIVQRIFELGYHNEYHGAYDGPKTDFYYKTDHYKYQGKSELIGHKYERLARQELLAKLADNYLLRQTWGEYNLYPYNVARYDLMSPDIDSSILYYKKKEENEGGNDREEYDNWRAGEWLEIDDWPSLPSSIFYSDDQGKEWLNLYGYKLFKEPMKIGDEKYHTDRREIKYWFRSFLVAKEHKEVLIDQLQSSPYRDIKRWPEAASRCEIMNAEYYWSELSRRYNDLAELEGNSEFQYSPAGQIKVHIPVYNYYLSGIDFQQGAKILKPSKLLYSGMGIDFINKEGIGLSKAEEVLFCPIHKESELWVRKDKLVEYLDSSALEIVISISGEKLDVLYSEHGSMDAVYRKYLVGTYWLSSKDELQGGYNLTDKYDD